VRWILTSPLVPDNIYFLLTVLFYPMNSLV
jgi:hypothetical protein